MARKAPLPPHADAEHHNPREDPDAAFMRIFYPSTTPTSVPRSTQTPPFSCSLLSSLFTKGHLTPSHCSHLACSFLTDRTATPTLLDLKKYTQSLCLLLSTLQAGEIGSPSSPEPTVPVCGTPTFDFLNDLSTPYSNGSPTHHLPLPSVLNTLHPFSPEETCARGTVTCAVLKAAEETGDVNTLMAHANENQELLDHRFASRGGLLALLPSDGRKGEESERGIFSQWLRYTQSLVDRVAELEREIALMREVLGGEYTSPGVCGQGAAGGKGARRLVFPQDRYVLAGLNESTWERLNEELDVSAEMTAARDERAGEKLRSRGWSGEDLIDGFGGGSAVANFVSWVEVTSRFFRVKSQENVFVIPAWDVHPGAEAVRKIENEPLVQTVSRGNGQQARMTAKERSDQRKETEALKKENDDLRFRLRYEQDEMQKWFVIWDVERKERMTAVDLVHEELDAEKETWEIRQRVLEASGLEQLLFSENDLSEDSISDVLKVGEQVKGSGYP